MDGVAAEKVTLTGEKETLLITLYGKGEESLLPDSLLQDRFAAEAIARIDYDFARLKITRDMMIGLALRAHMLDGWTRGFISRYRQATVLHLGCGLDTRVFRIDPPPGIRWFDVDYPEVMALRRRLYPQREGYRLIGASVTEPGWLDQVPADRPAIIVAEGLFPYLHEEAGIALLDRLTGHLPGGELVFDGYNRLGLWMIRNQPSIRATGAEVHWAIEDAQELERRVPRLSLVTELMAYQSRGYDPAQIARMSWGARMAILAFRAIPGLGKSGRLMRFRF